MPVDEQLALHCIIWSLWSAASTMRVALWAGVGFGTVSLVTNRVIKALWLAKVPTICPEVVFQYCKGSSKRWVELQSCPAWRNGWLMVGGTLVPIISRPWILGNTWLIANQLFYECSGKSYRYIHTCYLIWIIDYLNSRSPHYWLWCWIAWEPSMILLPGWRHIFLRNMRDFLGEMNGYGETLHTHWRIGARALYKSNF